MTNQKFWFVSAWVFSTLWGSYDAVAATAQTCADAINDAKAAAEHKPAPAALAFARRAESNERVAVFKSNAAGMPFTQRFVTGSGWSDSFFATSVAFGDPDSDGFPELAFGRYAYDNMRFQLLDDGPRNFALLHEGGANWSSGHFTTSVAFGDFDGDGIDELAVARAADENARVIVLKRGPGGFFELFTTGEGWSSDHYATSVAFGDTNGDGRDELAIARYAESNSRVIVLDRDPSGMISQIFTTGEAWGEDNYATSVAFGDLDNDGKDELAVARRATGNERVSVFRATNGVFSQIFTTGEGWGEDNFATSVAFGDFDADGNDELAVARYATGNERVAIFDQLGASLSSVFTTGEGWASENYATSVAFGDIDADATDELAVARKASQNERIQIWKHNPMLPPARVFTTGEAWGEDNYATAVAIATPPSDTDRDGYLDAWELRGFDADCDGIVLDPADVPFQMFGANRLHKDIYVELDFMPGQAPTRAGIQAIKEAFALAPIDAGGTPNPDGMPGINIHIDTGSATDAAGLLLGDDLRGGGDVIPFTFVSRLGPAFDMVKNANFDAARRGLFRYVLSAQAMPFDPTLSEDGKGPNTCGDMIDNLMDGADNADPDCVSPMGEDGFGPGSCSNMVDDGMLAGMMADGPDLMDPDCAPPLGAVEDPPTNGSCSNMLDDGDGPDGMDLDCQFGGGWGQGSDVLEFNHDPGTLMHELGHTLGLEHGGTDTHNCKPNYVSVMNYDHQMGIVRGEDPGAMTVGTCLDGVDNQPDGFMDLNDPDCAGTQDLNGDGVLDGAILDFSPPRKRVGRAQAPRPISGMCPTGAVPCLVETALIENTILDVSDQENLIVYTPAMTRTFGEDGFLPPSCNNMVDDGMLAGMMADGPDLLDPDCKPAKTFGYANAPIDWSGDGVIQFGLVQQADIDQGGHFGTPTLCEIENKGTMGTLVGADDWHNLKLPLPGRGSAPPKLYGPEPTLAELQRHRRELLRLYADLSLSIEAPAGIDPGAELDLELTVHNAGPRAAQQVRVLLQLPPTLTYLGADTNCAPAGPGEIECVLGALDSNGDASILVSVRFAADPGNESRIVRAQVRDGVMDDPYLGNNRAEVQLNRNPDCSQASLQPSRLWPPNHQYHSLAVQGIHDDDGDAVRVRVTGVTQDEAPLGPGKHDPDALLAADGGVSVRSERDGGGDGRVYHLTVRADDPSGGACTVVRTLCVPHDEAHPCVDQGPLYDSSSP